MTDQGILIKKILDAKNMSEQEKIDIIRKIVEEKTIIYPSYPVYPDTLPCSPIIYPMVTFTGTGTEPNVTGTAVCFTG